MIPRYYQEEGIKALFDYFIEGNTGNPICAMPTGSGKSLVIAEFIKRALQQYPTTRVVMLTHVKELIEQNLEKLLIVWPSAPVGVYSAGLKRKDTGCQITFAGIQSVAKVAPLFARTNIILVDECHLVPDKSNTGYRQFIDAVKAYNPQVKVIGLSATPYRMKQGLLTEGDNRLFTDIAYDITGVDAFNKLIHEGYLAPLVPKATKSEFDLNGVKVVGGEFQQKALQKYMDEASEITFKALEEMCSAGADRKKWLIFSSGVQHAHDIVHELDGMGISAVCVTSTKAEDQDRDQILKDFKAGKYRALVNNNILTTGFDDPEIDLIGVLRPTMSPGLWVQMLGRGTRPLYEEGFDLSTLFGRLQAIAASAKQNCLVLDYAGNTPRLGPINDPIIPKAKNGKGGGVAPIKLCEGCGTYCHASVRFCDSCGMEFPAGSVKYGTEAGDGELIAGVARAEEAKQIVVFKVDSLNLQEYQRKNPPSIKATYFCGLRTFDKYICLEHKGYVRKLGRDWWRQHIQDVHVPETIDEAADMFPQLNTPTHIRVWVNKKPWPEVMAYDFSGSGFVEAEGEIVAPF